MKRWVKALMCFVLVVALALGLGLPTFVAYIQDGQTNQVVKTVDATSVSLDLSSALTVLQKYRIAISEESHVELDSAQNMDGDEALEMLFVGLDILFPGTDEEIPFDAEGFSEVNHSIILKMEGEDSVIYWDFLLENDAGDRIYADVDDDTGIILYLRYTLNTSTEEGTGVDETRLSWKPLFLDPLNHAEPVDIFYEGALLENLEQVGYSTEDYTVRLQKKYCNTYLTRMGSRFEWEENDARYGDNSYLYSVMLVNDEGGYYVMTFSVSNSEIIINTPDA